MCTVQYCTWQTRPLPATDPFGQRGGKDLLGLANLYQVLYDNADVTIAFSRIGRERYRIITFSVGFCSCLIEFGEEMRNTARLGGVF